MRVGEPDEAAGRRELRVRVLARPGCGRGPKNSPSRWRFRPPNLVTFRFRVRSPGSDSTYSRSVLGARGTVRPSAAPCKGAGGAVWRYLRELPYAAREMAIRAACSKEIGPGIRRPGG